jgi:hypothetical protein
MAGLAATCCYAATAGATAHLGYFIHGERHKEALAIILLSIITPTVLFWVQYKKNFGPKSVEVQIWVGKKRWSTNLNTVYLMPILLADEEIRVIVLNRRLERKRASNSGSLEAQTFFFELSSSWFGVQSN